jgi:hypothetical protein
MYEDLEQKSIPLEEYLKKNFDEKIDSNLDIGKYKIYSGVGESIILNSETRKCGKLEQNPEPDRIEEYLEDEGNFNQNLDALQQKSASREEDDRYSEISIGDDEFVIYERES